MVAPSRPSPRADGLVSRFLHLLSAFGVEAALGPLFYLWLAWHDAVLYGDIMYACYAGSVVGILVTFGLYPPLVRELRDGAEPKETILRYVALRLALMSVGVVVLGAVGLAADLDRHLLVMSVVVALGFGLRHIGGACMAALRVEGLQRVESRCTMLGVALAFAFAFAALALGAPPEVLSLYQLVWGATVCVTAFRAVTNLHGSLWSSRPDVSSLRPTLWAASTFATIALLNLGLHHTTVFAVERWHGATSVGHYCAAMSIIDVVTLVVVQLYLNAVFYPAVAGRWRAERELTCRIFRSNALWLMAFTVPTAYVLYHLRVHLIGLFYPPSYAPAIDLLASLAWCVPLSCLAAVFYQFFVVATEERTLLAIAAVAFVANLAAVAWLVPRFDMARVGLVSVLTVGTRLVLYAAVGLRRHGLFGVRDVVLAIVPVVCFVGLHRTLALVLPLHGALVPTLAVYVTGLAFVGRTAFGPFGDVPSDGVRTAATSARAVSGAKAGSNMDT